MEIAYLYEAASVVKFAQELSGDLDCAAKFSVLTEAGRSNILYFCCDSYLRSLSPGIGLFSDSLEAKPKTNKNNMGLKL